MQKLSFGTKFWFGVGQAAEGIQNAAFAAFLLLFYSQVLGVPAYLVGIALASSLALDSVTDPITGSISDALRHRWGRRHPFMYASVLPVAATFALVFAPPSGMGHALLFVWLLAFALLSRVAMTLYHVPHLALGAELTSDYHERTVVVAYRNLFGLLGAAALYLGARGFFFTSSEAYPKPELDPAPYPSMGLAFGIVMGLVIFASALGTHSSIPTLPQPSESIERFTLRRLGREMREALANKSFRALFLGLLLFFIARGMDSSLSIYMGTFFWGLDTAHVLLIPAMGLLGVVAGTPIWAVVARRFDKRRVFMTGLVWYSAATSLIPFLKIVGLYPAQGTTLYVPLLYVLVMLGSFGAAGSLVTAGSMLADIADEHERDVGRRQEGIFFGALSFSAKAAAGLGSALAGIALSVIRFPVQVAPEEVQLETVVKLGLLAGPGAGLLMLAGTVLMGGYSLDHERLLDIQRELRERRRTADSDVPRNATM